MKAVGSPCANLAVDLINAIISEEKTPKEWEDSYIVNIFNGKGEALNRGNYRGLKLLDHVMKVLEKVIRGMINIDDMQFGFIPGKGTTDVIFILRQMQESTLGKTSPYTLLSLI